MVCGAVQAAAGSGSQGRIRAAGLRGLAADGDAAGASCAQNGAEAAAVFPGYLFLHLALEDEAGFIRMPEARQQSPFAKGERVRVREGAMAGLEGVFLARDGGQRALVLLEMLQRRVKVRLPLVNLAAA